MRLGKPKSSNSAPKPLDIDTDDLRRRYEAERAKRVRTDGNGQYVAIADEFSHFADDPHVDPGFTRDPLRDDVDVVVVGGGFSGLLTAGRLREVGVEDIRVIERGGDFGGVWYWNRYPGAACDVESYVYLPLLEELGYVPSEKYAKRPEIAEHARAIARHFDLYGNACFQTQVTDIRWNDEASRWIIKTDRGDEMRARFVCLGTGAYARPKLPGIPGMSTFTGHSFHTSRWDYDYTGGDSTGKLDKLADKRVALIGTGATAVQCLPFLGDSAKQLYVFQRTPSAINVRDNRPTDPEWANSLTAGWHRRRMENFNAITSGMPMPEDLVSDAWTTPWAEAWGELAKLPANAEGAPKDPQEMRQLADYIIMEKIRRRVDDLVDDPETAAALKPYYNLMCKRPCFHDEFLQTFNRPNVKLVDTKGRGVERIDGNSIIVDGKAYEVDLIVYGTGFEQNAPTDRAGDFTLVGRNGATLAETWSNGMTTLHGILTPNFPNLFQIGGLSHTGGSANFPFLLSGQCAHVAAIIKRGLDSGVASIEASNEAADGWSQTIRDKALPMQQFLAECTPGYFNTEGKVEGSFFLQLYGGGLLEYFKILDDWRADRFDRDMHVRYLQDVA